MRACSIVSHHAIRSHMIAQQLWLSSGRVRGYCCNHMPYSEMRRAQTRPRLPVTHRAPHDSKLEELAVLDSPSRAPRALPASRQHQLSNVRKSSSHWGTKGAARTVESLSHPVLQCGPVSRWVALGRYGERQSRISDLFWLSGMTAFLAVFFVLFFKNSIVAMQFERVMM